jgi:hypothetical protein
VEYADTETIKKRITAGRILPAFVLNIPDDIE